MSLSIKKVHPQNEEELLCLSRIHAYSWKQAYIGLVPQSYLDDLDENSWVPTFRQRLSQEPLEAVILWWDDRAVGTISYGASRDLSYRNGGEIVSLYLMPEFYNQGYGRMLLGYALGELKARGYESAFLWVLDSNRRARRFYEQYGFQPDGTIFLVQILEEQLANLRYVYDLKSAAGD